VPNQLIIKQVLCLRRANPAGAELIIGIIFYLLVLAHHIWLVKQVQAFEPMRMISVVMLFAFAIFSAL
jgi:hypothetical protein